MRRPRRGWRRPKAFSQSIGTAGQNAPTGSERRPTIFPRKISGSAAVEEHPEHVRRADSEGTGHAEEAMRVEAVFLGQRAWLVTPVSGSREQVADAGPRHGCGCRVGASGRATPMRRWSQVSEPRTTKLDLMKSQHHEHGPSAIVVYWLSGLAVLSESAATVAESAYTMAGHRWMSSLQGDVADGLGMT